MASHERWRIPTNSRSTEPSSSTRIREASTRHDRRFRRTRSQRRSLLRQQELRKERVTRTYLGSHWRGSSRYAHAHHQAHSRANGWTIDVHLDSWMYRTRSQGYRRSRNNNRCRPLQRCSQRRWQDCRVRSQRSYRYSSSSASHSSADERTPNQGELLLSRRYWMFSHWLSKESIGSIRSPQDCQGISRYQDCRSRTRKGDRWFSITRLRWRRRRGWASRRSHVRLDKLVGIGRQVWTRSLCTSFDSWFSRSVVGVLASVEDSRSSFPPSPESRSKLIELLTIGFWYQHRSCAQEGCHALFGDVGEGEGIGCHPLFRCSSGQGSREDGWRNGYQDLQGYVLVRILSSELVSWLVCPLVD